MARIVSGAADVVYDALLLSTLLNVEDQLRDSKGFHVFEYLDARHRTIGVEDQIILGYRAAGAEFSVRFIAGSNGVVHKMELVTPGGQVIGPADVAATGLAEAMDRVAVALKEFER